MDKTSEKSRSGVLRSMTGYGRGEAVLHGRPITVELRAVNNRYLDCTVKLPRIYLFAEDAIKRRVQAVISRGKVDVFVTIGPAEEGDVKISVNRPVAQGYAAAMRELWQSVSEQKWGDKETAAAIRFAALCRCPDVFLVEKNQEDQEVVAADIGTVLDLALADFEAMRIREGEKLAQDIRSRAAAIAELTAKVEARAPDIVADYRARLEAKLSEVLQNTQIDESRILTEAAIFADKVAVDEETVRLRSHLSQLEGMLAGGGAVGRKLDFLIQEFNREANTIGSKCSDLETARYVVDIKGEIEKIREQVQNIE